MRKILPAAVIVVFIIMAGYLLLWPVPVDPAPWNPPEAPPLEGVYEPNHKLAGIEKIGKGVGVAPEDVDVDMKGRIYGGMEDGRIVRFSPDGKSHRVFADTGGRPLGMDFDRDGNLIVADAYKGLLSVAPDGSIEVLSTGSDGVPFKLTDDVDAAPGGIIYFSDASDKFPVGEFTLSLMEHRPHGRLLAYNPATGSTATVLDDLYFANGVAVSPDESFVLVNETGTYRVRRYWLKGEKKGRSDIFIDNLPAFPDGISCDGEDTFWLALVSPRDPALDVLLPHPFLRKMVVRLPEALLPKPKNYGFVLGLDTDGNVVYNLQDPSGSYGQITSVEEHDGMLYFGSLAEDSIGRTPVPE